MSITKMTITDKNIKFFKMKESRNSIKYYSETKRIKPSRLISELQGCNFILPENTRFFKKYSSTDYLFLIERPPEMRTVIMEMDLNFRWKQFQKWCFKNGIKDGIPYFEEKFKNMKSKFKFNNYNFQLLTPYIVNLVFIGHSYGWFYDYNIYIMKKKITSLQDITYRAPFYNIYRGHKVCLGYDIYEDTRNKISVSQIAENLVGSFWNSDFNSDYAGNIRRYSKNLDCSNYFVWEYLSNFDPFSLMNRSFIQYRTLETCIKEMENGLSLHRSQGRSTPVTKIASFL